MKNVNRFLFAPVLLIALLTITALLYRWYEATPYVQAQRLQAAHTHWETQSFTGYRLHYEVQQGTENDFRKGLQHRSVSDFFRWMENYPRQVEFRCGGLNFECTRPVTYRFYAEYDEHLGYPRTVIFTRTRHPDWLNPHFWAWLIRSGGWQQCENLACTTTDRTTVVIEMEH
jgi:hypothetical protein